MKSKEFEASAREKALKARENKKVKKKNIYKKNSALKIKNWSLMPKVHFIIDK